MVWKVLGALLVIWLAVTVLGAVIKGLFWLAVIGGVLFVGTAVVGSIRGRNSRQIR